MTPKLTALVPKFTILVPTGTHSLIHDFYSIRTTDSLPAREDIERFNLDGVHYKFKESLLMATKSDVDNLHLSVLDAITLVTDRASHAHSDELYGDLPCLLIQCIQANFLIKSETLSLLIDRAAALREQLPKGTGERLLPVDYLTNEETSKEHFTKALSKLNTL